jgi:MFS family permease
MIKEFGLTNFETGLLSSIPYAAAIVVMLWWGAHSDRTRERTIHVAVPLVVAGIGLAGCIFFKTIELTVLSMCITLIGCFSFKPPFWAMVTERLPVGFVAAGIAQINSTAVLSALIGPLMIGFIKDRTGSFVLALVPLALLAIIGASTMFIISRPGGCAATLKRA